MQAPPRKINAGQVIFLQALIFGLSLFGFRLLIFALDLPTGMTRSLTLTLSRNIALSISTASIAMAAVFTCLYVIVALILFFLAGLFAAQRTGKLGSGVLAGLCGGLLYGVLS